MPICLAKLFVEKTKIEKTPIGVFFYYQKNQKCDIIGMCTTKGNKYENT